MEITPHPLCPVCAGRAAVAPGPADHARIHEGLGQLRPTPNRAQRKRGARDAERAIAALVADAGDALSGPCRCGEVASLSVKVHGVDRHPRQTCPRCHARMLHRLAS